MVLMVLKMVFNAAKVSPCHAFSPRQKAQLPQNIISTPISPIEQSSMFLKI